MDKIKFIENNVRKLLRKTSLILCLGAATIFLCLSALDYVSTPENFITFLRYRIIIATFFLVLFVIVKKHDFSSKLAYEGIIFMGICLSAITVELMILKTGGHVSPYYVGIGLCGIWGISFLPVKFGPSLAVLLAIYGLYVLPIVVTEPIVDYRTFLTANILLLSLLSSSLVLQYFHFKRLMSELGLRYDLEQHKLDLEMQVNDGTDKLFDSTLRLQKTVSEREQYESAVKRSSDEWRATVDATGDIIMMVKADFTVVRLNKAASLFYNQPFKALIGKSLFHLFPAKHILHNASSGSTLKPSLEHQEGTVYLSDKKVWSSFSVDPIRDDRGQLQGAVFTMRDITERIKAEEEQQKLQEEFLQIQKMDSIGNLAGGVAHDFNNILTAIIGFSHVALMQLPEDHPAAESVKIISDSGLRASSLTRQLLAFSRKQVLEMKVVNMNIIIEGMAILLRRVIGENIILDLKLQSPLKNILADTGQMEQVLMNLVVNARDAMPSGGRVEVQTSEVTFHEEHEKIMPGSYIMVSVVDTGTGIRKKVQEQVFEPFFTTKGRGKGTGLGLSTVYGIIKQHNGHITLHSEHGLGTTFTIYFPLVKREADVVTAQKRSDLLSGTETVLVVDDEPTIRKLIIQTMQPLGYKMLDAPSGEEALKVCDAYPDTIDLLVADVVLSGMNGMQLADALRQQRPDLKVIFISGYTDDAVFQQNIIDRKLILMQKPLIPTVLMEKIREVLDKKDSNEPAKTTQDLSGMRILYADDDESSRLLVSKFLERSNCLLDICENGQSAVEMFQSGSYDLVLMDIKMPVMDGFAASRAMRSWETSRGLRATPIIAITGRCEKDELDASLKAGCTSYMLKPIYKDVLLEAISGYSAQRLKLSADTSDNDDLRHNQREGQ
jgi:two-component system cell cycle sensor histidine kinase/response regulator CckA